MALHCPFCDGKKTAAMGLVAYSDNVLVEHKCDSCGCFFRITDRRSSAQRLWASGPTASGRDACGGSSENESYSDESERYSVENYGSGKFRRAGTLN